MPWPCDDRDKSQSGDMAAPRSVPLPKSRLHLLQLSTDNQFAQFLYQRLDPIGFFNPQGLHSPEQKWNTPHTTSHSKRLDEIGISQNHNPTDRFQALRP